VKSRRRLSPPWDLVFPPQKLSRFKIARFQETLALAPLGR
jgi:hypothetical protein